MKNQLLHTPEGVRDIYNKECEKKLTLQHSLQKELKLFGYQEIQTPTFEFFDIFSKERGSVVSKEMFKFFDREGNTLVLRPDITPSIARCAVKYYQDESMPLRFCYTGNTFINNSSYQGRLKESTHLGCELIGDSTPDADAEMIAVIINCLLKSGLTEFQVELGEADFFQGLVEEAGMDEETESRIKELIEEKNYFGVEEILDGFSMPEQIKTAFLKLQELFGTVEKLEEAKKLSSSPRSQKAIERLEQIYEILKCYGLDRYVSFELGMLGGYKYYTGIIFKGYTYGTGEPIVTGGRYDSLLGQFGKDAPAIGFAIRIDQLLTALSRQKIDVPVSMVNVLIVYEECCLRQGISLADSYRKQGIPVQCIRRCQEKSMGDYDTYAVDHQMKEIIYVDQEGMHGKRLSDVDF